MQLSCTRSAVLHDFGTAVIQTLREMNISVFPLALLLGLTPAQF